MSEIRNCRRSPSIQRNRTWCWQTGSVASLALLALAGCPAAAATLTVTCERADVIVPAWNGPLTITYTGAAEGTLQLTGPYGDMSLPAKLVAHAMADGTEARAIKAFGDTTSTMPDLVALEACIATKIEPSQGADNDSYLNGRDMCLAQTPPTPAPIPMTGQIDIGIFPGKTITTSEVVIEMKRIYLDTTKGPGGRTVIGSFPGTCSLVEK